MTTEPAQDDANGCFLCPLAGAPCDVPTVAGTLLAATEGTREAAPTLTLALLNGEQLHILARPDDRKLMQSLCRFLAEHDAPADATPDVAQAIHPAIRLPMRLYHLAQTHAPNVLQMTHASAIVLAPDLLLNITDINNAEYCVRQYVLRRMVPSVPTDATLRGTLVHQVFKEMLKSGEMAPDALLDRALASQLGDLALRQIPRERAAAEAAPHLRALAAWYARQRQSLWQQTPHIRAETFLLAPEIGLKGRLDALLRDDQGDALLELKTGEVRSTLPKRQHRWQVHGYQALLAVRHPHEQRRAGATLLYSGTPGAAEGFGVPFILRDLHRVLELRNLLALAHVSGAVPEPPGAGTCGRCIMRQQCARASVLLGWQPPELAEAPDPVAPEDAADFARMYRLLWLEARAAEERAVALWRLSPEERRAAGLALGGLTLAGEPKTTASGEWEYHFHCAETSELREGDAILLSDGDPVRGEVVSGTILHLDQDGVTVWTPERIAHPALIDRHESDIVHDRTVRNLWRWLGVDARLRALAAGRQAPQFDAAREEAAHARTPTTLNPEQRHAVARALAADDFLLIQGPPGTGKTSVVAHIIKQAVARGERVLVAAFTNQAVDNALRRLVAEGVTEIVRLGHDLSVAPDLKPYRLIKRDGDVAAGPSALRATLTPQPPSPEGKGEHAPATVALVSRPLSTGGVADALETLVADIAESNEGDEGDEDNEGDEGDATADVARGNGEMTPGHVRAALRQARVVAATTATWSAERYDEVGEPLKFDLAIVDEATQLTVPSLLGALRFAQRFVLVGDEQQLPPLVQSEAAAAQGLNRSLFAELHARWGEQATVALRRQYRMHPVICGFASQEFYRGALLTEDEALTVPLAIAGTEDSPLANVLDPTRPLVFVDVPEAGTIAEGKASEAQAAIAARLALALRQAGLAAGAVGVIAPYRAQVAAIRQRLAAHGEDAVLVDTVDRFQGGERQAILFSFGGVGPRGRDFLADPHRLNVALTRAQRKLIILGNRAALEGEPRLARLIAYCAGLYSGRGGIVTARRA